jgi:hypothetical protein
MKLPAIQSKKPVKENNANMTTNADGNKTEINDIKKQAITKSNSLFLTKANGLSFIDNPFRKSTSFGTQLLTESKKSYDISNSPNNLYLFINRRKESNNNNVTVKTNRRHHKHLTMSEVPKEIVNELQYEFSKSRRKSCKY